MSTLWYTMSALATVVAVIGSFGVMLFASILLERLAAWNGARRDRAMQYRARRATGASGYGGSRGQA